MTGAPIALSCGEPAGVGPEIAAKAWAALGQSLPFFMIGDPAHLAAHAPETPCVVISDPAEAPAAAARGVPVLAQPFRGALTPGKPNPDHAQGVIDAIARGVDLARSGAAAALCTAPIHKKALQDGAGFGFPGHTEYLAHLGGDVPVVMMLACPELRVVPATIHIALRDVAAALTPALLEEVIRVTRAGLQRDFGIPAPRLAIAGLNPHAGEGGAMGDEELIWIAPLLDKLRAEGFELRGPLSADTMFHAGARAGYDAAVAMYHDQALIPIKTVDFAGGVNVTLGLPFIRTSPDHGTALDIAGQDRADPTSLIAALRMAKDMARRRGG
ncbi:4-hydroxythreonine-4-phosphate dehydrogenase [Dinoroseobacter shibae DFL 12 = DSM 16493]|jgi:4-hydroxythreonine-4-phosphate dehydrogenase|uniref:4-hydroxythreonine-4-phosphate dehydrogenase n=1 Tax=Dinoroseobacter shibae (strain DSM 16493 / NCIMB 14021 / DFL 12) TaxID=398580 RepID=A8LI74_DINSH|nr:4-hydroxythreonine-4-phosphate dehydrogenase PdxA [Dinoroseobacter shibae]ABV92928.1 4-hydroxythreonine-4-phosphate dehydrogenase [Dinoroseobacter shibae DFL 12 = DSM 16493]URF47864.1 4-hydroxythreonine-4-phosphate dehydrogenase PdxA [Dinoroseobacter shibae]URF52173.1 4-hydroxythreonine-4-phosphate dehydrogenase PdxA [Dinoroseobacter shibae]